MRHRKSDDNTANNDTRNDPNLVKGEENKGTEDLGIFSSPKRVFYVWFGFSYGEFLTGADILQPR